MTECAHCQSELIHPLTEYIDAADDTKIITVYRCFSCGANIVVQSTNPKYLFTLEEPPKLCFSKFSCMFKSGEPEPAEIIVNEYENN
jgi:hypothetical protein